MYIENGSILYFILIFGICSIVFALAALLLYVSNNNEIKSGNDPNYKSKWWEKILGWISFVLFFFSLPAFFVFGLLHEMFYNRGMRYLEREIKREMRNKNNNGYC